MSGELPLSRNYVGVGRPPSAAVRRPPVPALARRTMIGLSSFVLLILFCLLDLNTVAYQLFGITQFFSFLILAICVTLLLTYRFTIYRDLGPSGRVYLLFIAAFLAIGTPIGITTAAGGLSGRWHEIRLLLPSLLIVASAAVAARGVLLAYGLRFTLRLLCLIALVIPLSIWFLTYFPELYRVEVGQARDYDRASGTFANPNEAGTAACIVAAIFYSFMMIERSKIVSITGVALAAFALILTASRGAFVIFALLTFAQIVISPGFKKMILVLVGGAAIAGILYVVYNVATVDTDSSRSMVKRMESLWRVAGGEVTDETTGGRLQLAMNGINAWSANWLLGNGLGSQSRVGAANIGPHNTYIAIGGEAGVIPLSLFFATIVSLLWRGWTCHVPAVRTLAMGFAVVMVMACFTSHGVLTSRELSVMLGISFGLLAGCLEMKAAAVAARRRTPRSVSAISPLVATGHS